MVKCITPRTLSLPNIFLLFRIKNVSNILLSERLVPLRILGAQLRALLKPLEHHSNIVLNSLKGAFNRPPIVSTGAIIPGPR